MTSTRFPRFLRAILLATLTLATAPASFAANGDCGQPKSAGVKPAAVDALAILKKAVNQTKTGCEDEPCICDVDHSGAVKAVDALIVLKVSVGQVVAYECRCNGGLPACTSAELESRAGSDLDSGWTGAGHNSDIVEGSSIRLRILRRCTDNQAPCTKNGDCTGGDCKATCDCNDDTSCELTGPTQEKHCLTTLTSCTTNADCTAGVSCVSTFGPPLPLSAGGSPVCVVSYFASDLSGTADSSTGETITKVDLKSRVFSGIALDQPCPRCGKLSQNPKLGDTFTCESGQFPGAACTVEGVTPDFGGVSHDCPPLTSQSIAGSGLSVRFNQVTTGTVTRTAELPCGSFAVFSHPSRGNGKCLDTNTPCTSNADCMRCTGDPTTACTSNAQCTGKGSCAEAPDQPVTCGYWCHCGFCNDNGSLPCFSDGECPEGQTCQSGTGDGSTANTAQQKPNECGDANDKTICSLSPEPDQDEKCSNTFTRSCSLQPFRSCTTDANCATFSAGTCEDDFKPCFGSRITRTGEPSPLGSYCELGRSSCSTNADCQTPGDHCEPDSSVPETVALFCVPATSAPVVNIAGGITGPGAIRLKSFLNICRCGDTRIGCDEQCDDGNTTNGDGCDDLCQQE